MSDRDTTPAPPLASVAIHEALSLKLAEATTEELAKVSLAGDGVVLVPIGSTEPHGPHLPLSTDALLSEEAALRAARKLRVDGTFALVAPPIAYGVTRYAAGFHGAIGVSAATLVALLVDVANALLDDGFAHVAFVNNHLEPAHVAAIEEARARVTAARAPHCVSFPNQLSKRWGRTLTDEFKRGDCHAGRYETSLVLAADARLVRNDLARALPPVDISLSKAIAAAPGRDVTFAEIGMTRAYTGAPAEGTIEEGEQTYARLVEMIVREITEHLADSRGEGDTTRGDTPITPASVKRGPK